MFADEGRYGIGTMLFILDQNFPFLLKSATESKSLKSTYKSRICSRLPLDTSSIPCILIINVITELAVGE